jgi:hypothetical protein
MAPAIAQGYIDFVRRVFAENTRSFGPTLKGIFNSTSAANFRETIRPNLKRGPHLQPWLNDGAWLIDEAKLIENASAYAEAVCVAWLDKINAKIGAVTDVQCHRLDGVSFAITGRRDGRNIHIQQQIILNVSSNGKLFNQFPARISVDGKAISEAQYKKMFAQPVLTAAAVEPEVSSVPEP